MDDSYYDYGPPVRIVSLGLDDGNERICPECKGTGYDRRDDPCEACGGEGVVLYGVTS